MFCELFGPLVGLDAEWKAQGATPGELDLTDFCFDYVPLARTGGAMGMLGGYKHELLEDNETRRIYKDEFGRTMKLIKARATIALPMDYPVTDMESWLKIKPFFEYGLGEGRVDTDYAKLAAQMQKEGVLICESIPGGYDMPRQLMGEEALAYAVYDQPGLIHDMMQTFAETACRVVDDVCKYIVPDCLCVHEDMAGKSGPMYGPNQVREFIAPYYSAVWQKLSAYGTKLFSQDSDGNMNAIMNDMVACGVNVFWPLEPAAGMDVVRLREKYGKQFLLKAG